MNVVVFADPMEDWKASIEVQRAIETLKSLKSQMDELGATEATKSVVDILLQDAIGESFFRILSQTGKIGLEQLKQLHKYLFDVLKLERGNIYNETCCHLEAVKESKIILKTELNIVLDSIYCGMITLEEMWMNNVNVRRAIKEIKELKDQVSKFGVTDDIKNEIKLLLLDPIEKCFKEEVLNPIVCDETKALEERCEICFKKLRHFYWYFLSELKIEPSVRYHGTCIYLGKLQKSFDGELETTLSIALRDVLDTIRLEIINPKCKEDVTSDSMSEDLL